MLTINLRVLSRHLTLLFFLCPIGCGEGLSKITGPDDIYIYTISGSSASSEKSPPVRGQNGDINVANITETTLDLNWAEASDDLTPQTHLEYKVMKSDVPNIGTREELDNNGELVMDWTANVMGHKVQDLLAGNTYYFNVIVRDNDSLTAVYNMVNTTTLKIVKSWSPLDGGGINGINKNPGYNAYNPNTTVMDSKLYAIWQEENPGGIQMRAAVYNTGAWTFIDGGGVNGLNYDPANMAGAGKLTVFDRRLYAIWTEINDLPILPVSNVRVAVYNGDDSSPSWKFADGTAGPNGINYDTAEDAMFVKFCTFNSKLYAVWREDHASLGLQIRAAVYNGDDESPVWKLIDGNTEHGINYDPSSNATWPDITAFNSKLYCSWIEYNIQGTRQVRIAVYNGNDNSPEWKFIDGKGANGINFDSNQDAFYPAFTTSDTKLYITWTEYKSTVMQTHVASYNGNDDSPVWSFIYDADAGGLNYDLTQSADRSVIYSFNSFLYTAWSESNDTANQLRIAVYNDLEDEYSWNFLDSGNTDGLNSDPGLSAFRPQLIGINSKLFLIWQESNGTASQIRVLCGE